MVIEQLATNVGCRCFIFIKEYVSGNKRNLSRRSWLQILIVVRNHSVR